MKHSNLSKTRALLVNKGQNTPVAAHCGQYSYESSLVMRICEAGDVMEDAAAMLENIASSYAFGDEYNKICEILERLNNYHEKRIEMLKTGKDWGTMPEPKTKAEKKKMVENGGVFGKSWAEIEKMQGGKISLHKN